MSQKVTYAKLHEGFFVPGTGEFKATLPPDNKTLIGFRMLLQDNGTLLLQWGNNNRVVIAAANIKAVVLAPEDSKSEE